MVFIRERSDHVHRDGRSSLVDALGRAIGGTFGIGLMLRAFGICVGSETIYFNHRFTRTRS